MITSKVEAREAIGNIFRLMHRMKVPFTVRPFRMQRLIREWDISKQELDDIRRRVIREVNYIIV